MGLLFVMPRWEAASELWLQRMIAALEPHVAAIATAPPAAATWQGRIPVHAIPDSEPPRWRRVLRRLRVPVQGGAEKPALAAMQKAVDAENVNTVFVHFADFALRFEQVWSRSPHPLFVHCHGYDITWDFRRADGRLFFPPNYARDIQRLANRATMIVNSRHSAARLKEIGVPENRIIVKYIGVPVPSAPCPRLPTKEPCVLYLGRLQDVKGPDKVITAFEIACDRGLKGRLTLAGDGHLRAKCEQMRDASKYKDRITLAGAVDAAQGERLRAEADIFTAHNCIGAVSRQEEAYGVSIVEAMAAALPVVTGRSGGVVETVTHNETGLLVAPGDIEAHADALLTLANDPDLRREMGHCGWQRARLHFSVEKEQRELLRIFQL